MPESKKYTFKEVYQRMKQIERENKRGGYVRTPKVIDMLINIKSYHFNNLYKVYIKK